MKTPLLLLIIAALSSCVTTTTTTTAPDGTITTVVVEGVDASTVASVTQTVTEVAKIRTVEATK